jgi:phage terminase small subunit
MEHKSKLTAKQQRFVQEFCVDLNAHRAAERAGYSKRTARQIGAENLSKPYIVEAIRDEMRETEERIDITKYEVIKDLIGVKNRCMQVHPVLNDKGDPIGEYRFNANGALRALQLLGKHIGMFTEKLNVDTPTAITVRWATSQEEVDAIS